MSALAGAQLAGAPPYRLQIVVQTGDTISSHLLAQFGFPAVNNNGLIAFPAGGPNGVGIFTQVRQVVSVGTTIGGIRLNSVSDIALNDNGTVAFAGHAALVSGR